MFRIWRLLLSILIAAGNVSFGNATTVRSMREWSYEKEADYHVVRYLHDAWDNESTGFTIECRAGEKPTLTTNYDVMGDNYFKAYKRKQLKPKMEIKSVEGRLTILGELDDNSLLPQFVFSISQSSSVDFLKILASANAVMVFPNHSFKIWQIKGSSEIQKFLSSCVTNRN
jgi:superfamily II RNA helicase